MPSDDPLRRLSEKLASLQRRNGEKIMEAEAVPLRARSAMDLPANSFIPGVPSMPYPGDTESVLARQQLQSRTAALEVVVQEKRVLEGRVAALEDSARVLEAERAAHQHTIDSLNHKLSVLQQANATAATEVRQLQATLAASQQEKDGLLGQVTALTAQVAQGKAHVSELERKMGRLNTQISDMQRERREAAVAAAGFGDEERRAADERAQLLSHQLSQTMRQLEETRGESAALSQQLSEALAKDKARREADQREAVQRDADRVAREAREREMEDMSRRLEEAMRHVHSMQQQQQQQQGQGQVESDKGNKVLSEAEERLKGDVERLQRQLAAEQEERRRLGTLIKEGETREEHFRQILAQGRETSEQVSQLALDNKALRAALSDTQARLDAETAHVSKLSDELQHVKGLLDELQQRFVDVSNKNMDLTSQNQTLQHNCQLAFKNLNDARRELDDAQRENQELIARSTSTAVVVAAQPTPDPGAIAALHKQLTDVQAQHKALQEQLAHVQSAVPPSPPNDGHAGVAFQQLELERQNLIDQVTRLIQDNIALRDQLEATEASVRSLKKDLAAAATAGSGAVHAGALPATAAGSRGGAGHSHGPNYPPGHSHGSLYGPGHTHGSHSEGEAEEYEEEEEETEAQLEARLAKESQEGDDRSRDGGSGSSSTTGSPSKRSLRLDSLPPLPDGTLPSREARLEATVLRLEEENGVLVEQVAELRAHVNHALDERRELRDKLEVEQHLTMQLAQETETIGEYIGMYHEQREKLQARLQDKEAHLEAMAQDRAMMELHIQKLQAMVSRLADQCQTTGDRKSVV